MYVGDTRDGSGLHHMLWEVVANALDEHPAGRATRIEVTLDNNGSVTVDDHGAGIPVHMVNGIPFAQLALTTLNATATLYGRAPHAHVGLPGVGICVVNDSGRLRWRRRRAGDAACRRRRCGHQYSRE
jgi:DNA gyrase subunit B